MEIKTVKIQKPEDLNLILGQSHFIKTVEDLHEALVNTVPGIKFGLAFCESSGPCLVRYSGTDPELTELAQRTAFSISAGHSFSDCARARGPSIQHCRDETKRFEALDQTATANPVE